MPSPRLIGAAVVASALILGGGALLSPPGFRIGNFSAESPGAKIPDGWERYALAKVDTETRYDLVRADSTVVVRARSDGGASGLAARQRFDLERFPVLEWRWKVDGVVEGGNARTKDGDDYAARIFVTFDYRHGLGGRIKRKALSALGYDNVPSRAINYVWANRVPAGAPLACPFTDWVMMIPLQSGEAKAGEWVTQRRNVLADYRALYDEDPPPVTGVAIMTDTDNTDGSATAYYGDIVFRPGGSDSASSLADPADPPE